MNQHVLQIGGNRRLAADAHLGAAGAMGGLFAARLASAGERVAVVDILVETEVTERMIWNLR